MNSIIHWNCQGYKAKYVNLIHMISTKNPAIILLQESMMGNNIPRAPKGYSIYAEYNAPTPGNGLVTLIKNNVPHRKIDIETQLQATAFKVRLNQPYTLCNVYISPRDPVSLNDISALIRQLPEPLILCGDFNCRHPLWDSLCTQPDARSLSIESALLTTSTSILNTGAPTHFHLQTGSSSSIDLSICSSSILPDLQWTVMDDLYGSDHKPVMISEVEDNPHISQVRYLEHKANWNLFRELTYWNDADFDIDGTDVNQLITQYNCHIITAAQIAIPKSSGLPRKYKVPWWTSECAEVIKQRKKALKRYQRSLLVADKISYCRARAIAKYTLNKTKRESWERYITGINEITPMSKIWKRIRKIRGKYENVKAPYLIKNDEHITDPQRIADIMANHYAKISSNNSYKASFQRTQRKQEYQINFATRDLLPYNSPINSLELDRALSSSGNSASGDDQISYNMIKNSHKTCQTILLQIMNKIFESGQIPTQWLNSTILSFPKPGKCTTNEENHRPISLTSCVCKLMERIINIRLTFFLESNELLPAHQFGFRRMHSTVDALNRFTSEVMTALHRKQQVICVSFDIKKAYDKAWRFGIIKTLHDMGLRGYLPAFIKKILHNRTFRARIGYSMSEQLQLEQGIPQGSVLSCSLFSIAISGVLAVLSLIHI